MSVIRPFRLNRRSFLRGVGVAACLPYLECMATTGSSTQLQRTGAPKRLAYLYVPNGVSLPGIDSPYHQWNWFPKGEGKNYTFTQVLSSLAPHRDAMTILGGLSHPKSRKLLGHLAGDTWLTAGDVRGAYNNSISVDQVAAQAKKSATRYPSLILSGDGGVGFKSRASTLSFDSRGQALPSEHRHRQIFERYFSVNGKGASQARRASLHRQQKVVDLLLEDAKRLQQKLGVHDRLKVDEHLASLNSLEEQIKRNEAWLNIPLKPFDASNLDLAVEANIDPESYIRTMLDLIVLAFQLDLTEVVTYMIAREDGMGLGEGYPQLALGIKKGHHQISHDKTTGHWEEWGRYDQWLASHFGYFLEKMKTTEDEHGSLLDNTQILYGSACSNTHNARNYPLVLAGGKNMGLKHGFYTRCDDKVPMANLLTRMLKSAGVPITRFADSNENMHQLDKLFTIAV